MQSYLLLEGFESWWYTAPFVLGFVSIIFLLLATMTMECGGSPFWFEIEVKLLFLRIDILTLKWNFDNLETIVKEEKQNL